MPNLASASLACLTPAEAKINVIYLHGIDTLAPGELELQNRNVLQDLSQALSAQIALPRSPQACYDGKLCWNPLTDTPENAKNQIAAAIEMSRPCLVKGIPTYLLGFSSGGFLANKIFRYEIPHSFSGILSIGAASAFSASDLSPISDPTPLHFLLAENESVRKNAESLYQYYLKRGANVYWHTYKGEHALYFSEILPIMQSLSGSEL